MKYLTGAMIGMCGEYLYRVEFLIYPLMIVIALTTLVIIDCLIDDKK